MKSYARLLRLLFAFVFALAVYVWLKPYEPISSGGLAMASAAGALWLYRTRRGAFYRTAAGLLAVYCAITSVSTLSDLNDAWSARITHTPKASATEGRR